MLSQVLEKLASWLSAYFIISYVIPILTFAILNVWTCSRVCPWANDSLAKIGGKNIDAISKAFTASTALIGVAIIAYLYAAVSVFLREVLEGKHLPKWAYDRLTQSKLQRFDQVYKAWRKVAQNRKFLEDLQEKLTPAVSASGLAAFSPHTVARITAALEQLRQGDVHPLEEAANLVLEELERVMAPAPANRPLLRDIKRLHDDALQIVMTQQAEHEVVLQYMYPRDRSEIAPTSMGNIVASMGSYATTRYEIDLETFWPRMQTTVQSKKDLYDGLQQSKAQLDFLITMFWMTAVFTVLWTPAFAVWSGEPWLFVSIALLGPFLTWVWYQLACMSYATFAAQVRGAVDLCRLDFLKGLRLPAPLSLMEEKSLWLRIGLFVKFGQFTNLRYTSEK